MVEWHPPKPQARLSKCLFPEGGTNAGGRNTDLAGSWEYDAAFHAFCSKKHFYISLFPPGAKKRSLPELKEYCSSFHMT